MRLNVLSVFALAGAVFASCESISPFDPGAPAGGQAFDETTRHAMNGVYRVVEGGETFGGTVVVHWNGRFLNLHAEKDYITAALTGSLRDSVFRFEGNAWYDNAGGTLRLALDILPGEGGRQLARGDSGMRITIRGAFGRGGEAPDRPVVLVRERALTAAPFLIICHRGGFTNGGYFDVPDNSLEGIRSVECYGANAVEIDARITKDGVAVLFHDDNFTRRFVNGEYLYGPVRDFTFSHIRAFGRLRNGEPVPTLREALSTVLHETSITFVEIDMKNAESLPAVFEIQRAYLDSARALGRALTVAIDLPTKEIADAFLSDARHADAYAMCELDYETVAATKARIWSPRWTLGTLSAEADRMKQHLGVLFMPWTVNEPQFLDALFAENRADGVLTDVPNIVAYKWYAR